MSSRATQAAVPVIDIFAGPGGLGEGFSVAADDRGKRLFRIALSIEKDEWAHRTLELRSFYRQFTLGGVPGSYYDYLRCCANDAEVMRTKLFAAHPSEAEAARSEAWRATLGETAPDDISQRITSALHGCTAGMPWVLIGGPPCQAYSMVGRSRMKPVKKAAFYRDHRHTLYKEYLRLLSDHAPPLFIMENVKGLLSSLLKGERIFGQILADLSAPRRGLSYTVIPITQRVQTTAPRLFAHGSIEAAPSDYLVECERYGVPQARHRLILLGISTAFLAGRATSHVPQLSEICERHSVETVIGNLPALRSLISHKRESGASTRPKDPTKADSKNRWKTVVEEATSKSWFRDLMNNQDFVVASRIQTIAHSITAPRANAGGRFIEWESTFSNQELKAWFLDPKLSGICNHEARSHIESDIHRYLFTASFARVHGVSPKLADFPRGLLPKHKNVTKAMGHGMFNDRFRVQLATRPATTVTSHIAKDGHYFIHPDPRQCRSLTVREAARLQTFPDNYFFEGPRTEQYRQVGNAVPPYLARQIALAVGRMLCPARVRG